jgi:1-acyl-sn-glycerol-3-phosphate acyltransferase
MSGPIWDSKIPSSAVEHQRFGTLRALRRGLPILVLILVCLPLMLLTRTIESVFTGAARPYSSMFPRFVSKLSLQLMGIKLVTNGRPMKQHGALVANHSTWLDIFSLNACQKIFFVSKAEVANWPGIGILARATGTVFIARARTQAGKQKNMLEARLKMGHKLLFFPEGTSTDSLRVLPFKSTLFSAFFSPEIKEFTFVQPVSVRYVAPQGSDARFYGWWGDMEFVPSLLKLLRQSKHGRIEVTFHDPIAVSDVSDRKVMAQMCEEAVRSGLPSIPVEYSDA